MSSDWTGLEVGPLPLPLPPQNGQVLSPFQQGVLDLRWDDPVLLAGNSAFTIVGVNIYRSDATDRGPFVRINEFPVGGTFYRDSTYHEWIFKEPVPWDSGWYFRGDAPNSPRWTLKTQFPIVKKVQSLPNDQVTYGNSPLDVTVYIDGRQVEVHDVFGKTGEVTLVNLPDFDVATEKADSDFHMPTADSVVEVSYYAPKNHIRSGVDLNVWYRLTTVALDSRTPSGYQESPIGYSPALSSYVVESLDYIWREAVRRNAWILQQGGERVKFFIRKTAGFPCDCRIDPRLREWSKQPSSTCLKCFGTGFLGGYEGPYDAIIGPDDAERRISQGPNGRKKEHTYEVWTGPTPILTQRDFLVKQTNERYSIGPVRRPSNRGNVLQQHFNIGYLDEGDIRYRVPIDGTTGLPWPGARDSLITAPQRPVGGAFGSGPEPWPVGPYNITPMETEKPGTPDETEQRGRTRVWENQNT